MFRLFCMCQDYLNNLRLKLAKMGHLRVNDLALVQGIVTFLYLTLSYIKMYYITRFQSGFKDLKKDTYFLVV